MFLAIAPAAASSQRFIATMQAGDLAVPLVIGIVFLGMAFGLSAAVVLSRGRCAWFSSAGPVPIGVHVHESWVMHLRYSGRGERAAMRRVERRSPRTNTTRLDLTRLASRAARTVLLVYLHVRSMNGGYCYIICPPLIELPLASYRS